MTLVHAFVMSRVNYCNVIFTGAPKAITDKLQRVLNNMVTNISAYSQLAALVITIIAYENNHSAHHYAKLTVHMS